MTLSTIVRPWAVLALLLAFTGCSKEPDVLTTGPTGVNQAEVLVTPTIAAARTWYEQAPAKTKRPLHLNWDAAQVLANAVVVPLREPEDNFTGTGHTGHRRLLLTHTTIAWRGAIVELHAAGAALPDADVLALVREAYANYRQTPSGQLRTYTGLALVYSLAYAYEGGTAYTGGVPSGPVTLTLKERQKTVRRGGGKNSEPTTLSLKEQRAMAGKNSGNEPVANIYTPVTCVTNYTDWYVNGDYQYTSEGQTYCTFNGGDGSDGGGSGYGGGGHSGGTPPIPFDKKIDDSQLSPCAVAILNDLKGLNSGQLANVIRTFAGQSPTYNWTVKSGTLTPGTNAGTLSYDRPTHTVTTTFDTGKFSHATDLSVARTILHESIHAYIGAFFIDDPYLFKASYPDLIQAYAARKNLSANDLQHDDMVKNWVYNIAFSLEEYGRAKGYNLSSDYYNAMAWGGLEGTRAFQKLPNRNSIKEIILAELTGKDSSGNTATQQGNSSNCP